MPQTQDSYNLSSTVMTIPTGEPILRYGVPAEAFIPFQTLSNGIYVLSNDTTLYTFDGSYLVKSLVNGTFYMMLGSVYNPANHQN